MRFPLCLLLIAVGAMAYGQVQVSRATILVDPSATGPQKLAARELAEWLGKIVGATLRVSEANKGPVPENAIIVGDGDLARAIFPEAPLGRLGNEEVLIQSKGKRLLVAGGGTRGTVYAVNRLLHRQGVRWWTPWATEVPSKRSLTLKDLNIREKPTFEARAPFCFHAFDRDWARRNNSNSHHAGLTDEDGGKVIYEGFVHTFYPLVPPEKHFKDHPEWYSLIDGKRKVEGGQLCTTNPELRDFVVEGVRKWLKANPKASIVSVSQNDWYGNCQCANCKALDDAEGSPAASVLALANYVGEKIEKEYPNVAIDTLAYQYTRKAPKTLKPRPNVIVRLCSIECNFAQPLTHPSNASFAQDIKDWSRLTQRLYIWNYVTDFPNYMLPFPNWFVLGANERFFASNGVKGLFEQGAYQSHGSAMAEMQAWVQSQLLWNPFQNDRQLIHEFVHGYYGVGAKPIQDYLDLMATAAKDTPMNIWVGPDAPFFTYDTVMKAEELWNQALSYAKRNSMRDDAVGAQDIIWRIKLGQLPIRYVILSRWKSLRAEASRRGLKWPLPESRKAVADEWMKVAAGPGPAGWQPITHMNEAGLTPQAWAARFATDPEPITLPGRPAIVPLPSDLALPADADVVDLQDDEAKLYGEGDMVELRPDSAASDKVAARMPGSHHEWAFQMPMTKAPAKVLSGKWRVYVVARVEPGAGLTAGVYSEDLKRGLGGIEAKEAASGYKSFDLGAKELTKGCYVWVAPVNSDGGKAVWVDRVLLVRA